MIKKNLLFFLLLLVITVSGESCLGESENRSSATSVAVVDYIQNMGGYVMNLPDAILAAPELATQLEVGDCIWADFTIDYSHQPSANYITATEIKYQLLNNTPVAVKSGDMIDDYNEAISRIVLSTSPYYNGNVFVQIDHEEPNNQLYDYELIFNPDSIDENGVHIVFLKSKKLDKTVRINTNLETFNLQSLFETYGKDTIYQKENIEQKYRYVSLNFKYQSGVKEEIPVYSRSGNAPVNIYIFD